MKIFRDSNRSNFEMTMDNNSLESIDTELQLFRGKELRRITMSLRSDPSISLEMTEDSVRYYASDSSDLKSQGMHAAIKQIIDSRKTWRGRLFEHWNTFWILAAVFMAIGCGAALAKKQPMYIGVALPIVYLCSFAWLVNQGPFGKTCSYRFRDEETYGAYLYKNRYSIISKILFAIVCGVVGIIIDRTIFQK